MYVINSSQPRDFPAILHLPNNQVTVRIVLCDWLRKVTANFFKKLLDLCIPFYFGLTCISFTEDLPGRMPQHPIKACRILAYFDDIYLITYNFENSSSECGCVNCTKHIFQILIG